MTIITDSTRTILEQQLLTARAERTTLDAARASAERTLDDVLARLATVGTIIADLEDDLGITEPDPDEPIPYTMYTIIDDPWAPEVLDGDDPEPEGAA